MTLLCQDHPNSKKSKRHLKKIWLSCNAPSVLPCIIYICSCELSYIFINLSHSAWPSFTKVRRPLCWLDNLFIAKKKKALDWLYSLRSFTALAAVFSPTVHILLHPYVRYVLIDRCMKVTCASSNIENNILHAARSVLCIAVCRVRRLVMCLCTESDTPHWVRYCVCTRCAGSLFTVKGPSVVY